ncbi:MAG TPA: sigma-70 family RNA polymerase sigma factor [Longimicrobiales bacterium]|nr:sigma-70 family RNA polymerase sigma factor [Longimicrobiales bacterium]
MTERRGTFQEEALPHLDAVYRFALRLSGSPDQAQDLAQDTFVRAFKAWDQYTPGTQCKSWLFTICRNLYLRQWERGQRHDRIVAENTRPETPGGDVVNPLWSAVAQVDPEGQFFDAIVDEEVLRAIDALPEDFRTMVVLSDVEGLSYQQISDLVEVPVGTVKSRLFRGRRRLQKVLYEYAVEMGHIRGNLGGS